MEGAPTPPAARTVPGWHPDPQDGARQRYWDGTRWTEHTSPIEVPSAAVAQEKQWAMIAHLSALAALLIGFTFVGPLSVYLLKRDDGPFVRAHAAEALNFNLSVFIYGAVAGLVTAILVLVLVGLLLLPLILVAAVAWVVLVIVAAIKANNGEAYRYPLTIRFVT